MPKTKTDNDWSVKKPFIKNRKIIFVIIIIILALIPSLYFYGKYQKAKNSTVSQDAEARKLISEISKFMDLPEGETPTVATVSDIMKLKDQQFFQKAVNGDKVLIYQSAKKAILYRPDKKRIIEVAPVNISQTTDSTISGNTQKTESVPKEIRFVLWNGSKISGLTRKYETTLKSRIAEAVIAERGNTKNDYDKSVLIDLKSQSDLVKTLSDKLEISVGAFPEGEVRPKDGDFLIILGPDANEAAISPTPSSN